MFIIEVKQDKNGNWFHHMLGKNRKIIYHSESYKTKNGASRMASKIYAALSPATLIIPKKPLRKKA